MSSPLPTISTVAQICDLYPATSTKRSLMRAVQEGGWMVCKYADPLDGAREGLLVDEVLELLASDPGLVYLSRFSGGHNQIRAQSGELGERPFRDPAIAA